MNQNRLLACFLAAICAAAFLVAPSNAHRGSGMTPALIQASKFQPSCMLPFDSIKGRGLNIDKVCGRDGTAAASTPNAIQNEVKNNFCAAGAPTVLIFAAFDQLQHAATEGPFPSATGIICRRPATRSPT